MEKTKVLHIIKSLGRGGAETLLLETLKCHDKNKFEFYYIYFFQWKNELVNELELHGGKVYCLNATNNFDIFLKIIQLKKIVKNININIVHCHLPLTAILARLTFIFSKNLRIIYTEHNLQERYNVIIKILNKATYKLQHNVIAVSKSVEKSIIKNIGAKVNVTTILNGVDTNCYKRILEESNEMKLKLNINKEKIIIGNVCVFRKQKRLKLWVDIFEKINKINNDTIGILVGSGILYDEIKQYIESKNLQEKILLLGLQKNTKIYYSILDIFLLTSEFEGLPLALLEAMSMNCVPVVTNAGGVKEVIKHQINGLVVDINETENLISEINFLLNNKNIYKQLYKASRESIIKDFSIFSTTQKIENLYKN